MCVQFFKMEKEICKIYHNNFGIAFVWNLPKAAKSNKVQLVFNHLGFQLSLKEIELFAKQIEISRTSYASCGSCSLKKECKSILLETPSSLVSLAVNKEELDLLADLVNGTLFWLQLQDYLTSFSKN